jgi:exopolysaccharide production protein ExoZ
VGNRIVSIQLLRALACLLVLQVHLSSFNPLTANILSGSIGVDVFFVISGYIIVSSAERLPEKGATRTFLINRFTRVAPYYYLLTLLYLVLSHFAMHEYHSMRDLAMSFLFLPTGHEPVLPEGWTLQHEIVFYGFVGVALLFTRNLKRVALGFLVFFLLMQLVPPRFELVKQLKASINVEFFFGMLIYLYRDKLLPHFRSLAWLGAALVLLLLVMELAIEVPALERMKALDPPGGYFRDTLFFYRFPLTMPRGLGWGIPCAFLFVAILAQEVRLQRFDPSNLALRIGNASFTLYLLQHSFFALLFRYHVSNLLIIVAVGATLITVSLYVFPLESVLARNVKNALSRIGLA